MRNRENIATPNSKATHANINIESSYDHKSIIIYMCNAFEMSVLAQHENLFIFHVMNSLRKENIGSVCMFMFRTRL